MQQQLQQMQQLSQNGGSQRRSSLEETGSASLASFGDDKGSVGRISGDGLTQAENWGPDEAADGNGGNDGNGGRDFWIEEFSPGTFLWLRPVASSLKPELFKIRFARKVRYV